VTAVEIRVPEFSVVALVGVSGSGKSTFARRHFLPTEVLSSDFFRGLVADDESDQRASADAFEGLYHIAGIRLRSRRLCVLDATHTQKEARQRVIALASQHHALPVAIVLDLPNHVCMERNAGRPDRAFGKHVIPQQASQLRRSLRDLRREGFRHVYLLRSPEEVDAAVLTRTKLWTDRRDDRGPFDIIGDVHGCFDELRLLLQQLGYAVHERGDDGARTFHVEPPPGRKAVFLGDLVDRGPRIPDVLRLVMAMVEQGSALCLPGNHEVKLLRKLTGKQVRIGHGLEQTLAQLEQEPPAFTEAVRRFAAALVSHYTLDGGRLVVAHAGLTAELQGRASATVRSFALYGDTTGEIDEYGLPVRHLWAEEYRGDAMVVYGHTPVPEAVWLNRTICIDTGCVFGGRLTALRYPEQELVSVPAARVYCEPARPLEPAPPSDGRTAQQVHDDLLHLEDVSGKRFVSTRLRPNITVREENATAALEVMSRFAVDPHWLIYLPPTMSPSETSEREGFLEHPEQAFAHFRREGIAQVVCEQKHMGSRAVAVVCRDESVPMRRFGIEGNGVGVCYTRTGRPFFDDPELERAFLLRLRAAVSASDLWQELATDWLCLDCELMPWSAKAQSLLTQQYAPAAASGGVALAAGTEALAHAAARGVATGELLQRWRSRATMVAAYGDAYRRYCWPVQSLDDYRLAPFHLLASEGHVHTDRDHVWHMTTLARLCAADMAFLVATPWRQVDLADPESEAAATAWWDELTGAGGEGMVVKPFDFVARGKKSLAQPAVKCRGAEYLRIIYGPEYLAPEHLTRLRGRALSQKRSLAIREFALGIEALERFVRREPLRRVHECVFGVLALESEPVDPRL
jgi:polynucleotide kinase-phosphatase